MFDLRLVAFLGTPYEIFVNEVDGQKKECCVEQFHGQRHIPRGKNPDEERRFLTLHAVAVGAFYPKAVSARREVGVGGFVGVARSYPFVVEAVETVEIAVACWIRHPRIACFNRMVAYFHSCKKYRSLVSIWLYPVWVEGTDAAGGSEINLARRSDELRACHELVARQSVLVGIGHAAYSWHVAHQPAVCSHP